MKKSIFLTTNGLFIFSQQQRPPSRHSSRVVQDPRHFFGENCVSQNIPLAIERATSCAHPDAHRLTNACAGKDVVTREDAKGVFSSLGQNDPLALCIAFALGDRGDVAPLLRSAELGFAFAQAWVAELKTRGEEKFKFAQLAAAQGERDGFVLLGCCLQNGYGCEKRLDKAKENFYLASELGHVAAMVYFGRLLDKSDPQRWRWWGRAAALGSRWDFWMNFLNQVELFNSGSENVAIMFAIGKALHGRVNEEEGTIFNSKNDFEFFFGPAKQAIAFYEAQIKATKDAMHTWTQVGIRFNIVKDVRKLIAKLIWDSREEASYDVSERREQEEHEEQKPDLQKKARK